MSQSPWGPPLQQQQEQDPLLMEVDSSACGFSWQLELADPQMALPQQQDSLPMSIDPLGGGGGEYEDELISRLRSCPSLSPPRPLLTFSSASPPDISVTLWDPYTWTPPCSPQIDRAAAALPNISIRGSTARLLRWLPKFSLPKGDIFRFGSITPDGRPKLRIGNLDDGEEEEERVHVFVVKPHRRNPYGPSELVQQQFKFREDGELQYCIHCDEVFPSDAPLSDLSIHFSTSHRVLFPSSHKYWHGFELELDQIRANFYGTEGVVLFNFVVVHTPTKCSRGITDTLETALNRICPWDIKRGASNSRGLWEGYHSASEAANWGNEKPKEIDSQKSASRHVELPLAFDQSNTPPERMRVDNGKAAASTDAVQHPFFEEPAGASNSRGLLEGCQSASEAARGNEKPKEIDSQKSASRHVELPLAFDQSNTPPERMRVDNGKAAASTWSAVWEHFVRIIIDDTVFADCKHCKQRFAGGSKKAGTSTLRRHLDKLHGIKVPKASSSKNKNSSSKWKTPTPSLLPSLEPVASKPPRTTTQRKKRTDGANDLATQEVCARGKRTRRRDNPSSSGVTPSEVPGSASTVGHATEAPSTGMAVASSQIALSAAGPSGEVVRSIADTITDPGPKDVSNAILLMRKYPDHAKYRNGGPANLNEMDIMFDGRHVTRATSAIPGEVPSETVDLAGDDTDEEDDEPTKAKTGERKKSSVPDLREKLSGVQRPQLNSMVQIPKPAVAEIAKSAKPVQKRELSAPAPAPALPVTKNVNEPTAPKQSQEKADSSLDRLLKSLDLQKYSINFQAEEVDMKALVHMNEEDMKSLGIPMGPRKKILSALASKRKKSSKSLPPTS